MDYKKSFEDLEKALSELREENKSIPIIVEGEKDREALIQWHQQMILKGSQFNFRDEIGIYCEDDVRVLQACCLRFREIYTGVTEVDPFSRITIASACNTYYRNSHLPANTIGLVPHGGYRNPRKASRA